MAIYDPRRSEALPHAEHLYRPCTLCARPPAAPRTARSATTMLPFSLDPSRAAGGTARSQKRAGWLARRLPPRLDRLSADSVQSV
ncbi:MAG: hypothetical protein KY467_08530 [Gemmatimonadetes bacterium]|nr:hypothetical protein [Gemmatimonadota bacterium]